MKVKKSPNKLDKIITETNKTMCLIIKMDELSWLWHCHLGHVNF